MRENRRRNLPLPETRRMCRRMDRLVLWSRVHAESEVPLRSALRAPELESAGSQPSRTHGVAEAIPVPRSPGPSQDVRKLSVDEPEDKAALARTFRRSRFPKVDLGRASRQGYWHRIGARLPGSDRTKRRRPIRADRFIVPSPRSKPDVECDSRSLVRQVYCDDRNPNALVWNGIRSGLRLVADNERPVTQRDAPTRCPSRHGRRHGADRSNPNAHVRGARHLRIVTGLSDDLEGRSAQGECARTAPR